MSQEPIRLEMIFARGEAITFDFIVNERDPETGEMTSTPRDISGWTLEMTLARDLNVSPKIWTESGTVLNGPTGEGRVELAGGTGGSSRTNLEPGAYQADLWRTDAGEEELLAIIDVTVRGVVRHPA
jgi:hypothetical protein